MNIERDERLKDRSPALLDKMKELDDRARVRLFELREKSLRIWHETLLRLLDQRAYAALYAGLADIED